ncbi:MAG: glycosyltransferase family 1 protein [Bacteroidales bacterium]|nr:glycosyltransferase family 1 protein [Bacteroidales bacterium]
MLILMITGSYPPDVCGVGDYTHRLMNTATAKDWELYRSADWSLISFFHHLRAIKKINPDAIFMQYPTQGYGWSLIPHLLCFSFSLFTKIIFVVVFHELSQQTKKSRLASNLMLLTGNAFIFTAAGEREYAARRYSRIKKRSTVIKLLSNIEQAPALRPIHERGREIVHFGLIRPEKGIETFIEVVAEIKKIRPGTKAALIGQVPNGKESYFERIRGECEANGILIYRDPEQTEVADLLNDSRIAFLPFPDGASERRGTLLAAIKNGAIVVTTTGASTTNALETATVITETLNAPAVILGLLGEPVDKMQGRQQTGIEFLKNEWPASWDEIARKYIESLQIEKKEKS